MATSPDLTRRQLLLGALLPFAGAVQIPRGRRLGSDALTEWLPGLFPDTRAAAALGALYLRGRPEEKSAATLARTLFGSEIILEIDSETGERIMHRLRAARARDFCNDDLVILQGWSVTRTEARLLALLSLCSAPA